MRGKGPKPGWAVVLTASAGRDIDSLAGAERSAVLAHLAAMQEEPLPTGKSVKKLRALRRTIWRMRAGDFRILYGVEAGTVTIWRVVNRRDLDRVIASL